MSQIIIPLRAAGLVHSLIESLRGLAIKQGIVDPGFQTRLRKADRIVYPRFVEEVDRILAQGRLA